MEADACLYGAVAVVDDEIGTVFVCFHAVLVALGGVPEVHCAVVVLGYAEVFVEHGGVSGSFDVESGGVGGGGVLEAAFVQLYVDGVLFFAPCAGVGVSVGGYEAEGC